MNKPFLKWAGNKFGILERLKPYLKGQRLVEPFLGSGAAFLNSETGSFLLGDKNQDLIHLYQLLNSERDAFIEYCQSFFKDSNNTPEKYYEFRTLFNTTPDVYLKSALFLYLNKHCFNGLCRYNREGKFNTPFGRYKKPYFPDKEMKVFYRKSEHAKFLCADFLSLMSSALPGDVIYCDPPYVPWSLTAKFTGYHRDGFSWSDQRILAKKARELCNAGHRVIISNHALPNTYALYQGATILTFPVRRVISCKTRRPVEELLAIF